MASPSKPAVFSSERDTFCISISHLVVCSPFYLQDFTMGACYTASVQTEMTAYGSPTHIIAESFNVQEEDAGGGITKGRRAPGKNVAARACVSMAKVVQHRAITIQASHGQIAGHLVQLGESAQQQLLRGAGRRRHCRDRQYHDTGKSACNSSKKLWCDISNGRSLSMGAASRANNPGNGRASRSWFARRLAIAGLFFHQA